MYFIERDEKDRIIPCAPNKVALTNIVCIKPHKRVLPVGFTTKCKSATTRVVHKISVLLQEYINPDEKLPIKVPMERIEEVIELVYSIIENDDKNNMRFVSKQQLVGILRYMQQDEVYVMTRYSRQLSKFSQNNHTYLDAPDNGQDEGKIAKQYAIDDPVLIMLQQDGTAEGWNGAIFWWPVLVPHQNIGKAIYAQKASSSKVRQR